jgi:hypothetical protein
MIEKIASIENSADLTEGQKVTKLEEPHLTINHNCGDFADILSKIKDE